MTNPERQNNCISDQNTIEYSYAKKKANPISTESRWSTLFSAFSNRKRMNGQGILSIRWSGSITVEAAIAFFLTVIMIAAFYMLFSVIGFQIRLKNILQSTAENIAAYGIILGNNRKTVESNLNEMKVSASEGNIIQELAIGIASAPVLENVVISELEKSGETFDLIEKQEKGLSFIGSGFSSRTGIVRIACSYNVSGPFWDFFGLSIPCFEVVQVQAWTGKSMEKEDSEQIVYITEKGTVYHTSLSCSYLNVSVESVLRSSIDNRRNQGGEKYSACHYCGEGDSEVVYITKNGTKYHSDRYCISLKRTVISIPISQVGDRGCCKKCGE